MKIYGSFTIILLIIFADAHGGESVKIDEVELPGIPIEVTDPPKSQKNDPPKSEKNGASKKEFNEKQYLLKVQRNNEKSKEKSLEEMLEAKEIVVSPGQSQVIEISKGFLNRIVTPFESPKVITVNEIDTKIKQNVVYVATNSNTPIGLYIYEEENPAEAIPLILNPKQMPPIEVVLKYSGAGNASTSVRARRFEETSDYLDTLVNILRDVAQEKIPPGYTLVTPTALDNTMYYCNQAGLATEVGQILDGHNYRIIVLMGVNNKEVNVELNEKNCTRPGIIAISSWPNTLMGPNEPTEIYLVENKGALTSPTRKIGSERPSLIGHM